MEMNQINLKIDRDYNFDRERSDKFEPLLKKIIGETFLVNDPQRDMHQATDLLILTAKPLTFACRVRTYEQYLRPGYKHQFTIRSRRPSGEKTEIDKIIEGFGDYFLYGFSNPKNDGSGLMQWFIGDLRVFRRELILRGLDKLGKELPNQDRSSYFYVFEIRDFPKDFLKKIKVEE